LKLYEAAQWKTIEPYISTKEDVRKILGQPKPVFVRRFTSGVVGFDYDPDWTIVITYWGRGCCIPKSLIGTVANITLYPKKQVSLKDMVFLPAFKTSNYYVDFGDGGQETQSYTDDFGLSYSIYRKDDPDGQFFVGDLESITYGASRETEKRLRGSK
jgi:hypothetical protein